VNSEQYYAGIDIGGTKISAVVTKGDKEVLGRAKKKSRADKGTGTLFERAAEVAREACSEAGITLEDLAAVGVGAPSPILPNGVAIAAPNLGWKNVPVKATLEKMLKRPVFAENDCNAGTFGEYSVGGHSETKTLIGLFVGTGLGGGLIKDGKLIVGENCMAAEVGHMTIQPGGRRCACGKLGCIEAYASKTGMGYAFRKAILLDKRPSLLTELTEGAGYDNIRSSLLKKAWQAKDQVTREVLEELAEYLGIAIGNLVTLLGPNVVVLGGGVMEALGEELLPVIRRAAREHTFPRKSIDDTRIELATLGDDAVALGAMAYAKAHL